MSGTIDNPILLSDSPVQSPVKVLPGDQFRYGNAIIETHPSWIVKEANFVDLNNWLSSEALGSVGNVRCIYCDLKKCSYRPLPVNNLAQRYTELDKVRNKRCRSQYCFIMMFAIIYVSVWPCKV